MVYFYIANKFTLSAQYGPLTLGDMMGLDV